MARSKKRSVTPHDVKVAPGWTAQIKAAQERPTYRINGLMYERIRYGDELDDWGADSRPCGDCAVIKGQYHVPGCDIESCPACGGQAISCTCLYEDHEARLF